MITQATQILSDRIGFDPSGLQGTLRIYVNDNIRVIPNISIESVEYLNPTLLKLTLSLKRYTAQYRTDTGRLFISDRQKNEQTSPATIKFDNGLLGETP